MSSKTRNKIMSHREGTKRAEKTKQSFTFFFFSSPLFFSLLYHSCPFTSLLYSSLLFSSLLFTSLLYSPLLFSSLLFTSLLFHSTFSFLVCYLHVVDYLPLSCVRCQPLGKHFKPYLLIVEFL